MVIKHSELDISYNNIRNYANFDSLKKLNFEKLTKEEQIKVEEAIYGMMCSFKKTTLEIVEPLPRRLSNAIDQSWSCCMLTKRQIREAALAQLMLNFDKE